LVDYLRQWAIGTAFETRNFLEDLGFSFTGPEVYRGYSLSAVDVLSSTVSYRFCFFIRRSRDRLENSLSADDRTIVNRGLIWLKRIRLSFPFNNLDQTVLGAPR